MNKYFAYLIFVISFITVIFYIRDFLRFPNNPTGEMSLLKNFTTEFPDIKNPGFYTDEEDAANVLFRIQNTVMPVFVSNESNYNYVFCYSRNFACQEFLLNGNAILLRKYSQYLFLFQKPEENK